MNMDALPNTDVLGKIQHQLESLNSQMTSMALQQQKSDELFAEFTPILREVMRSATNKLAGLEAQGYFAFGAESLKLIERIVKGFSPDDVKQLGDALVSILETVRALTQPEVLQVATEASSVLQNAGEAEPLGIFGMVRATRDDDVQKGMAVLMELMRHVGRAAAIMAAQKQRSPLADKRSKLEAITGAKKKKKKRTGVEPAVAHVELDAAARSRRGPPVALKVDVAELDGIQFSSDGHLADPASWSRPLAEKLAAAEGLELGEAHWQVLLAARDEYTKTQASPNIRRLTQILGMSTKQLYELFPRAPGRTVAKLAGTPKPGGCI
jgi:TusE/DsrC/DsvC family sulfur relay protein